jgi:RNA polymerase sigma-70 factor (ECF subfamily)
MALLGRDDRAWIHAARSGAVSEFESLFRAHWPRAYRAVYLVTQDQRAAEAIVQQAFLETVRRLDLLDGEEPFALWLHRLALGRAIDWSRGQLARWHLGPESALDETAPIWPAGNGHAHPHLEPDARAIAIGLASLAPESRAMLVLRYVLEYDLAEIARVLELPRGVAKDRLRRGVEQLEARLAG